MRIKYRFHLDDPARAESRMFVRDEGDWPFPSLPSPGDAVLVDIPGSGRFDVERVGNVTKLSPRPDVSLGARAVERLVFFPPTGDVIVEFHSRAEQAWDVGIDDQVAALVRAGFREVTPPD